MYHTLPLSIQFNSPFKYSTNSLPIPVQYCERKEKTEKKGEGKGKERKIKIIHSYR